VTTSWYENGTKVIFEADAEGNIWTETTHPDGTVDRDFTPATEDPGPEGGEEVPGGRNEENQEDLEEMAGPTDAGPGNVDPSEHDDGTGGGEEAQGPQPGVDNPSDEGQPTGGGEPVDGSGWAVTPSEEDDWGREKGREESPADAIGETQALIDPDQVTGVGTSSGARRSILEELSNPVPDLGARGRTTPTVDEDAQRLTVDEPRLSPSVESPGGRAGSGVDHADRLAQAGRDAEEAEAADPTGPAGRSILEELDNPVPDFDARSPMTRSATEASSEIEFEEPVDEPYEEESYEPELDLPPEPEPEEASEV
jgi:hypothetical protein